MPPPGGDKGTSMPGSKSKKKKKEAQFVLRLERELRDQFVDICQELDTSAAREIRRFIKGYIKQYDNGDFD